MKELYAIVRGRVQGVYFRNFVRAQAERLGVAGEARNAQDGTVHITAQGEEEKLRTLLPLLSEGSPESSVELVSVTWRALERRMEGFSVTHD